MQAIRDIICEKSLARSHNEIESEPLSDYVLTF